jgi:GNAT superfamily N-acetyltransferase
VLPRAALIHATGAPQARRNAIGSVWGVTAPALERFSDDHVVAAGVLLAERHRRQRLVEPLLSPRYEDPAEAAAAVAYAWEREGAMGAAAVRSGELVGYMIGSPKHDAVWGLNQWIENAGHAAVDPEVIRDLYAHAAAAWVEGGRTRHYAVVPATDQAVVDAWFRLSFGQQRGYGIREVPEAPWPAIVREATTDDTEALIALGPLVEIAHANAPTFAGVPDATPEELRNAIEIEIASSTDGILVAELDGRVAGGVVVGPVDESDLHTWLARPDGQCILGWQATAPDARGRGVGVALADGAFAWARRQGFTTMVTDWRAANLLASRFWPRRGFRTSFVGLYRSIP